MEAMFPMKMADETIMFLRLPNLELARALMKPPKPTPKKNARFAPIVKNDDMRFALEM